MAGIIGTTGKLAASAPVPTSDASSPALELAGHFFQVAAVCFCLGAERHPIVAANGTLVEVDIAEEMRRNQSLRQAQHQEESPAEPPGLCPHSIPAECLTGEPDKAQGAGDPKVMTLD